VQEFRQNHQMMHRNWDRGPRRQGGDQAAPPPPPPGGPQGLLEDGPAPEAPASVPPTGRVQ
jgi:hypothetical protein